MEEKTKLIVQVAIVAIALIIILAIRINPYFIAIPITLVELGYAVYLWLMGGTDAIVLYKKGNILNWYGAFVLKGVSYDKHTEVFTYDRAYELGMGSMERKWVLPLFGAFKFKHNDTTFTLISTLSKHKQHIYKKDVASLRDIKVLLFS